MSELRRLAVPKPSTMTRRGGGGRRRRFCPSHITKTSAPATGFKVQGRGYFRLRRQLGQQGGQYPSDPEDPEHRLRFVGLPRRQSERNIVREFLPEVMAPELPEDPSLYLQSLADLNLFETASFSEGRRALGGRSPYLSACAGMIPVAKATAAAWVRFMQRNLCRAPSRCVFTLPKARPRISAIS
jgi:hypothetical protein